MDPFTEAQVARALTFATAAHAGQYRRHTGEPYVEHVIRVATHVREATRGDGALIAIALLHDTVEDTAVTLDDLHKVFGATVAAGVAYLTKPLKEGLSRAEKVEAKRAAIQSAPIGVQIVKLADILDNGPSLIEHEPEFAKVWLREARSYLDSMDLSMKRHALYKRVERLIREDPEK